MPTSYAVLLRAVNVGGRRIAMSDLRDLLADRGYRDVRTYLASGNAVLTADAEDPEAVAADVSAALGARFGFAVPCLALSGSYLQAVVDACPYLAHEVAGKQLHAIFASGPLAADRYAAIDRATFLPEAFELGNRVVYLYVPDGLGRSELAKALTRQGARQADLVTTARNWNTVTALLEMIS
jgi:uncharacterized protein (DUF1697 family)